MTENQFNPLQLLQQFTQGQQQPQQPQPQPQPQANEGGNFFSNILGGLGNFMMPLVLILGAVFILPKLFSGGLGGLGDMFGGLMNMLGLGGNDNQQQPQQPANQPVATNVSYTPGQEQQPANNPGTSVATVRDISQAASQLPNDRSKAYWCAIDEHGNPIDGNCINVVGDTASTTKSFAAMLVADMEKRGELPAGFTKRPEIANLLEQMATVSSNSAADGLLQAVAKERGETIDQTMAHVNSRLKELGFQQTQLANFSGLPSPEDGGLYASGLRNVSTAYEMTIMTQMLGSQFPDVAAHFKTQNNATGLSGHTTAEYVKSGTAYGVVDRANGANKSAVGFDTDTGGAIAVLESRQGEWHSTIDQALGRLTQQSRFAVTDAPNQNVTPANTTPPQPPQNFQTILT